MLKDLFKLSNNFQLRGKGNTGQKILFAISIHITIQGHMFEIYTIVSEKHVTVHLVLSSNIVELETELSI